MQKIIFGDNLRILRQDRGLSQKEFSEFLEITQPSLSAYEKSRTFPTMEVLISIAEKCEVSLDWLCGLSFSNSAITTAGDIADFFYKLMEVNEIKPVIDVHDRLADDMETETEKWHVSITFFGNDKEHKHNSSVCNIIREVDENYKDLEAYALTKDMYDMAREKTKEYYANSPLSRKEYPELSREELLRKRREYLEAHPYE